MTAVILYECVDDNGEVEDFLVIRAPTRESEFFDVPNTISDIHFDEDAEALLKDYDEFCIKEAEK